ncbi:MAG: RsmD family RNA methyltransferase [Victivallales bacterium]|nr:RsmD family RNA methyltransferase [Victivallales bacterium]MCF7888895.1 RsmD family RNA methyltransferase [Victivallales bacterium]
MKIISGTAKNLELNIPKGTAVRPTAVIARKSIFESVGDWDGLTVLDLFSGSGVLGLEAASRGAVKIYFSEKSSINCSCIRENILKLTNAGVKCTAKVIEGDSKKFHLNFPELHNKIDIIFADPPYELTTNIIDTLFLSEKFVSWAGSTLLILETSDKYPPGLNPNFLKMWRINSIKKHGKSRFYFLKPENNL